MNKKEAVIQETKPVITIRPVSVEFKVIAELQQDGLCVEHVACGDKVMEINFNHGKTIQEIVLASKKALEEKYVRGGE
jgi:hypothetical protein